MKAQIAEIAAIADSPAPPTFDNTLVALEKSGQLLTRVQLIFNGLSWNPCGRTSRRTALSSRVRSSHWVAAVWLGGGGQAHGEPGDRAHPLGSHRVPLVGHGRRADLLGLERLLDLALVGQQPQVRAEPMRALGDAGERGEHLGIDLARVGLARDRIGLVEAERRGDHAVERLDLGVVAVEQRQEAGLGAGRPLDAQELQARRSGARPRGGRGSARGTRASPACRP